MVSGTPSDCYSLCDCRAGFFTGLFTGLSTEPGIMHPSDIALSLVIAAGAGAGLVFIGVLIQWSLRKARLSTNTSVVETTETAETAAPSQPEIAEAGREAAKVATASRFPEELAPVVEAPRAPVRIGLGLRKTR